MSSGTLARSAGERLAVSIGHARSAHPSRRPWRERLRLGWFAWRFQRQLERDGLAGVTAALLHPAITVRLVDDPWRRL